MSNDLIIKEAQNGWLVTVNNPAHMGYVEMFWVFETATSLAKFLDKKLSDIENKHSENMEKPLGVRAAKISPLPSSPPPPKEG